MITGKHTNAGGAFFASRMPACLQRELDGCYGDLEAEACTWALWRLREKLPAADWTELQVALEEIERLTFLRRQAIERLLEGQGITLQDVARETAEERRAG